MNPEVLFLFYIGFLFAILMSFDLSSRKHQLVAASLIVAGLMLAFLVARGLEGHNLWYSLFFNWFSEGRVGLVYRTIALSLGIFCGLSIVKQDQKSFAKALRILSIAIVFFAGLSLLLRDFLSQFLSSPEASVSSGFLSVDSAPGVKVKKIELPFFPTAIAIGGDQDQIFIAGYTGYYLQGGAVYRYDHGDKGTNLRQVGSGFTRPHGVAYRDGKLFVSRAGQFSKAINGVMVQEATGAVTRLEDLDSDGVFDFYKDIVSGLPGAQLPDGLHQNNGIEIVDDELYITVGVSTDHSPAVLDQEGTILKCKLDGSELEIFAKGLRNPFGISRGPFEKIYVTDNDPNFAELGDKLCLVEQGSTFQFPYDTVEATKVEGGVPPLARYSSAQGLSYIPKNQSNPWADTLLLAAYGDNAISSVRVKDIGSEKVTASPEFIAKINQVVDVEYAGNNIIYACSYADKALYRIELSSNR